MTQFHMSAVNHYDTPPTAPVYTHVRTLAVGYVVRPGGLHAQHGPDGASSREVVASMARVDGHDAVVVGVQVNVGVLASRRSVTQSRVGPTDSRVGPAESCRAGTESCRANRQSCRAGTESCRALEDARSLTLHDRQEYTISLFTY